MFIQVLKAALYLHLSQYIDYIPHVVQYIHVAYLMPNSLYLLFPDPYIAPPPLVTTNFFFSISVSLFLFHIY